MTPAPRRNGRPTARPRLAIAGLGLVSPLGHGAWETFTGLLAGRTLAQRAQRLPDSIGPVDLVRALGGVSIAQHVSDDPTVELAERAAREAAMMAGVGLDGLPTWIGVSKGAVGRWAVDDEARPMRFPEAYAMGPHAYLTHRLAQRTAIRPQSHSVAACASSLTALHLARQHLLHRSADTALVVTAEAALFPQFIHSYRRLGVLAPLTPRGYAQRPLDAQRQGFMLSQLGAAVILKRLPPGAAPEPGQLELLDTDIAAEAHDIIRASPKMEALRYIASRFFAGRRIDVLHPHAAGTAEHDPTELEVLRDCLTQSDTPWTYAVKGALGHGLGAAGLVSFVTAALAAKTRRLPPMPWLDRPIASHLTSQTVDLPPASTHAVFAAGFAGHTAGAVLRHY